MADKKISALTSASTPLAGTEVLPIVQSGSTVKVAVSNLTAGRAVSVGALTATGAANLNNTLAVTGGGSSVAANQFVVQLASGVSQLVAYGNSAGVGGRGTYVLYAVDSTGSNLVTVLSSDTSGNVTAVDGNLVIGTAGKGIDFSATSQAAGMTSELLADYEEGTWTPVLTANTPGDLSVTYSNQIGRYTKVGRLVSLQCIISTSAFTHTTASSFVKITGLPFTSANFANLETSSAISAFGGITKVGYTSFGVYVAANDNSLIGQASGSALAYDFLYITDMPSGTNKILEFTLTYNAAS